MKIFISSSAFSDLESIKDHYKKEGVLYIGEKYVVSIIEHIQTLSDNPDIGRKVPEFDEEKIIELIHSPFRIVYLKEKNLIYIIRVWRSERLLVLAENKISLRYKRGGGSCFIPKGSFYIKVQALKDNLDCP